MPDVGIVARFEAGARVVADLVPGKTRRAEDRARLFPHGFGKSVVLRPPGDPSGERRTGLRRDGIRGDVFRVEFEHAFEVVPPEFRRFPRQGVHQVKSEVAKSGRPEIQHGLLRAGPRVVPASDVFQEVRVERLDSERNAVGERGQDGGFFRRDGERVRFDGDFLRGGDSLADGGKKAVQGIFRQKRRRAAPEIYGFGMYEAGGVFFQLKQDAVEPLVDQRRVRRGLGVKRTVVALPGAERHVDVEVAHQSKKYRITACSRTCSAYSLRFSATFSLNRASRTSRLALLNGMSLAGSVPTTRRKK